MNKKKILNRLLPRRRAAGKMHGALDQVRSIEPRAAALLLLRTGSGLLLAGHGSQKLFGWFGGGGIGGTGKSLEGMGLRPGRMWALTAAASEMGGGLLTALGLMHPLGPIGLASAMTMATKAHRGKPIWVNKGGAEPALTNVMIAVALGMMGPGRYSLDRMLGFRMPPMISATIAVAAAGGVLYGWTRQPAPQEAPAEQPAEQPERAPEQAEERQPVPLHGRSSPERRAA